MIRFNVTCINSDGNRVLIRGNQGRNFWDAREGAEAWLKECFENTGEDNLVSVFGEQSRGTFRVDPFECHENGDAKGIYVDHAAEDLVTFFAEKQQWNERSIETLLVQFINEEKLGNKLFLFFQKKADEEAAGDVDE